MARRAAAATSGRIFRGASIQASSGTVRGRGRNRAWAVVAVLAIVAVAASSSHGALSAPRPYPGVAFDDRAAGSLVITTKTYRLTLSKRNGKVLGLVDRASGLRLARNTNRCLWGAAATSNSSYVGGCSFAPRAARRFSYHWSAATATLTLTYRGFAAVTPARAPGVRRPAVADPEPRPRAQQGRVPGGSRRRYVNRGCGLRADRAARRAPCAGVLLARR